MTYKMTKEQVERAIENIFNKMNVTMDILYRYDNGRDSITATVYLYKDNQVFGNRHGYEFYFNYDSRFNELIAAGFYPKIQGLSFLKMIPEDIVISYFENKVKEYLTNYINKGYSNLKRLSK